MYEILADSDGDTALRCEGPASPSAQRSGWIKAGGGRSRTRALATRVWARCSSVDRRIAMTARAVSTTGRRSIHPAVQFISPRSPARAAALRVGVVHGPIEPGQLVIFIATSY